MTKDEAGELVLCRYPLSDNEWTGDVFHPDVIRALESTQSTLEVRDMNDEDNPETIDIDLSKFEYRDGDNWIPLARIKSGKPGRVVAYQ